MEKKDQTINNIITNNIKNYSNILYNQSHYSYELINNISKNIQNKMDDFKEKIKKYLFDIIDEKNFTKYDFHNSYFEKNMLDFYNITNQKNEFLLNENSNKYTFTYKNLLFDETIESNYVFYNFFSFDIDFLNSIYETIDFYTKYIIDKNFDLTYEYFEEVKSYVDKCIKECKEDDSF